MNYEDDGWTTEHERLFAWLNGRCAIAGVIAVAILLIGRAL